MINWHWHPILTRSRFPKNYLKNRNEENKTLYIKLRNYCVWKIQIDAKKTMNNKIFWKTITPSLSDKLAARNRIHLTEKLSKLN